MRVQVGEPVQRPRRRKLLGKNIWQIKGQNRGTGNHLRSVREVPDHIKQGRAAKRAEVNRRGRP